MDVWTFVWLMVFMKIPIVGLLLLVRWAVRQTPEGALDDEDGGISYDPDPSPRPRHPHHPRPRLPRAPRRGPHRGAPAPASPVRTRIVIARSRTAPHR